MKYKSIADLPASVSNLSLIQKSKVLKIANGLIGSGQSPDNAIEKACKDILHIDLVKTAIQKDAKPVAVIKDADEQMISYEVIYEPNSKDAHGEWMSSDTILKGKDNFDAARAAGLVKENLFHIVETDAFTIEKTWIQEEFDVVVIGSEQVIKAGTWVAKVKYNDPELWLLKKANAVGGLSIQCSGFTDEETGEITGLDFGIELVTEEN